MHCLKNSFWSIAFGRGFTPSSQIYRPAQRFTSKGVICTRFETVNIDWMDFFSMNSLCCQSLTKDLSLLSMEESLKFKEGISCLKRHACSKDESSGMQYSYNIERTQTRLIQKSVIVTKSLHLEENPEKTSNFRRQYHHAATLPRKEVKCSLRQEYLQNKVDGSQWNCMQREKYL